jgi:DNA repair photolyase
MSGDDNKLVAEQARRGRGARTNATGRYEPVVREAFDDGWEGLAELPVFKTEVRHETARSIISTNSSPDLSFDQTINPYRGCEHGCIYCYARPTHAYLGHSPGLDFETKLYAKTNAAALLEEELSRRHYEPKVIALGAVTDPYQPIERTLRITRGILEVLERTKHPVGIVTKSAGIVRDIDILTRMAEQGLVKVGISITTLDRAVARAMEPRATTPAKRLEAVAALAAAGVPTTVMVAPVVPAINDTEIEAILAAAAAAGATAVGYVLLRLPLELKALFREWLATEFPDRAQKVISLLRSMHGGQDYVAAFGHRQRGSGPYADLIARRFRIAAERHGLERRGAFKLRTDLFQRPVRPGGQMMLI